MGKPIAVNPPQVVGPVAIFDTDRGIAGQDGVGFSSAPQEGAFPARLAGRIFEAVAGIDHVYVGSAQVVVRRPSGWDGHALEAVAAAIAGFFVFYR